MNYRELNAKCRQVFTLIAGRSIKDAIDLLGELCNLCRNRDLRLQLDRHQETYLNILRYSFELKEDPQKEKVYLRLIKSLTSLADDIKEDIIRSHHLLSYYSNEFQSTLQADQVVADMLRMTERLSLENDADVAADGDIRQNPVFRSASYRKNVTALFHVIWFSDKLSESQISLLRQISQPGTASWYDKSLVVSALTLSLLRHFDSRKIDLLFGFYEAMESPVWQRALVGLVLSLSYYDDRIDYYPEIPQRLKALQGMQRSDKTVEKIIIQYIKARDTEKITRKIQKEILPEMIKIKSRLEEKLDLENLLSSSTLEDKNPEWENFFKESPDVYSKLEEFTNLQLEGADVFLGAFAMLKQFDFFGEAANWFVPFYKENEAVTALFSGSEEGPATNQFAEGIERSNILCDSDKYSFCLNLKHMPSLQKSSIMELFNMELKAMNELAMDDELINAEARTGVIITQYFQDLYRFYKLYPQRHEFDDIFKLTEPLYEGRFFKIWINDVDILRNIGEFMFARNSYREAMLVFKQLIESRKNFELFEKIAYCYEKQQDYDHALEYYHKAELLGNNRFWLLNRIAFCYRKKGNYEKVIEYFREAEKLEPENLEVQALLGQAFLEMENYGESLKYYFKVEYLQPNNHKVYRPIAWCSFMLNKMDVAQKYLEKSITLGANKNDYINMGHIYWCRGQKQEAIQHYRMAVRTANMDFSWFSRVMSEDGKYLVSKGIQLFDLSLMIDYIRLSAIQ